MAHAPDEPHPAEPTPPTESDLPELVVGLGASAGGIQALSDFFTYVAPSAPIAYVVILHLSPEHESHLAEVLQKGSALPVTQVRGDTPLLARHVYVIPPNESLQVVDRRLVLAPMTSAGDRKAPVDMFFRTLAETYKTRSVAVVLSGTGPNGSNGMKRVKEFGGLTIAQTPDEAEYTDMPANAIGTGLVDYVLPVAEMPARIIEYHDRLRHAVLAEAALQTDDEREAMRQVLTLLRMRTGQDFSNYKASTLKRRVERRMSVQGLQTVAEYARLMRDQADEGVALMKELLISVTNFFRDPAAFVALERHVIPRLFRDKSSTDQLRGIL